MWSRAKRLEVTEAVHVFRWDGRQDAPGGVYDLLAPEVPDDAEPTVPAAPAAEVVAQHQAQLAALERDAFAKGYAQGERAGFEAGATRAEAMLRRLAGSLEELGRLRTSMIQHTERQMVQLALVVAKRILKREVTIDADLIVAMARVALDRLGERTHATVRMNPEDLNASALPATDWAGPHVTIVPDASLGRGQCQVESDFGYVEAGIDAQFEQIAHSLLGDLGRN